MVHCHAQCEAESVVGALGFTMADLMPAKLTLAHSNGNGKIPPHEKIWRTAIPALGTIGEAYLRSRGISLEVPASLRFSPDTLYQEGDDRQKLPAVIAPIQVESRSLIGVHRTYLASDGRGKADVAKPKKMLGAAKGGAVRLAPAGERLGFAEGIETALSAMQADGIPVWAALSAGGLKEVTIPPVVREVVIYADNDEPGISAARALASRLVLNKMRVGLKLPPKTGTDFNDLLREGGEAAIREIPIAWQEPAKTTELPTIDAGTNDTNLPSILEAVTDAVMKWNNPPRLFFDETSERIVRLAWPRSEQESPNPNHLVLRTVTVDSYRNILANAAHWVRFVGKNAREVFPPLDTVRAALADAHDRPFLPPLRAIVYAPTFAPNGRLLKPGYDGETHLWYAAQDDDPDDDVDADPNALEGAIALVNEALCDFLFETPGDKAHAISLFLLPFVREMVAGPTPLYNIEAPIAGTGKGLLSHVLLDPSSSYHMLTETRREDEQEKQIATACMSMWPTAVLDNVSSAVKSPLLASIVTSREPEIRVMGVLKAVRVRRVPIFVITANNPSFSEENARRVARIRIVSPIADPADRSDFKHPDLELWIEEMRADLCRAAVTMVKAWVAKGAPRVKGRPWGSFEAWAGVMGSLTAFLGFEGFGSARIERDSIMSTESRWRELIEKWAEPPNYGHSISSANLAIIAESIEGFFDERESKIKVRMIGTGLGYRKGRIFGKWKLERAPMADGVARWILTEME